MAKPRISRIMKADPAQFIVDGNYMRQQAREAVLTFIAPFTGVYRAVKGTTPGLGEPPAQRPVGSLKLYSKIRAGHKNTKPTPRSARH